MSHVHCVFRLRGSGGGEVGVTGENSCAAGEHDLHTGWIMNRRTCRCKRILRIRHEVPVAGERRRATGRVGTAVGVWLVPLQWQVEHCAQLLGKYCDFIWVRLALSLMHAAYERCARQQAVRRKGSMFCECVCACVSVCVWVRGSGKCVLQFHLICLSTQSEMNESN